jgi:hypothetical protein
MYRTAVEEGKMVKVIFCEIPIFGRGLFLELP